jgi:hypothetical protein
MMYASPAKDEILASAGQNVACGRLTRMNSDRPRSPSARAVNPDAGDHAITGDPIEWDAAQAAAHRSWREFPYYSHRYGERGWRFTLSDSAWIVTLCAMNTEAAERQIRWLRELLVNRGMPSYLLERHLDFLCEELTRRAPERESGNSALFDCAALLRAERERALTDAEFQREALRFNAAVHELPCAIPRMGAVLVGTLVDELLGFDAVLGRPSAIAWSSDRGHFSSPWITEVEQTAARVRHSVRLAATLKPQQRPR